jgi:two-component system, OmpR family, response regulator VicR
VLLSSNRLLPAQEDADVVCRIGQYEFNSGQQTLIFHGNSQSLTSKEAELLKLLCKNKNQLLPKKNILLKLWGDDHFFNSRSMDVFMTRLRRYLGSDPEVQIINIRGRGYKLVW